MNNWNTYPRPSLKRENNYTILNYGWTLNGYHINLPFPPEAPLSEYKGELSDTFVYETIFPIPPEAQKTLSNGGKLLLHLGAVDQVCTVYADEEIVAHSEAGYFPISCDISEQAKKSLASGKNRIALKVQGEDTLDHNKPYGKQRKDRGGMWYTPVTGIWQPVWCEWVSADYIKKITYKTSGSMVNISIWTECSESEQNPPKHIDEIFSTSPATNPNTPESKQTTPKHIDEIFSTSPNSVPNTTDPNQVTPNHSDEIINTSPNNNPYTPESKQHNTNTFESKQNIPYTPESKQTTPNHSDEIFNTSPNNNPYTPDSKQHNPNTFESEHNLSNTPSSPHPEITATLSLPEGNYQFKIQNGTAAIDLEKIEINGKKHQVKYWSAENPYLYQITFTTGEDKVQSYFALRTVSINKVNGINRICINGQSVFLNGVLDQGYFEKGLFVPQSPSEYEKDILRMKELGFNTLRKHIKIEPELFYYECDRLGMYVIQDMVNNGPYNFIKDTALATLGLKINDKNRYKNQQQKEWFRLSAFETQNLLNNHPCITGYTVFNEGWGQTDSDETGDELKARDPSRFYDYTSGWFEQKHSDVESVHIYFRTKNLKPKTKPMLLSEFGGFTRAIENHIWNPKNSYGYGKCKNESDLTDKIIETYKKMVLPAIPKGLCGAIYTQLSDIEDEINGFYTYDREICKVEKEKIRKFMEEIEKLNNNINKN